MIFLSFQRLSIRVNERKVLKIQKISQFLKSTDKKNLFCYILCKRITYLIFNDSILRNFPKNLKNLVQKSLNFPKYHFFCIKYQEKWITNFY